MHRNGKEHTEKKVGRVCENYRQLKDTLSHRLLNYFLASNINAFEIEKWKIKKKKLKNLIHHYSFTLYFFNNAFASSPKFPSLAHSSAKKM